MILGFLFGSCRICKCLGTSFLVYKGGFIDKNQDKYLYPFAASRLDSCRTGRPYESKLSTVNLHERNR